MATFIKIGAKTALVLALAAAVIVWAAVAPASLQTTVNAAVDWVGQTVSGIGI